MEVLTSCTFFDKRKAMKYYQDNICDGDMHFDDFENSNLEWSRTEKKKNIRLSTQHSTFLLILDESSARINFSSKYLLIVLRSFMQYVYNPSQPFPRVNDKWIGMSIHPEFQSGLVQASFFW